VRFYRDLLFEEELLKEEYIITQEKIKIQEQEVSTIIQEEANEDSETIFDLEEENVKSKSNLGFELQIVSQTHSYTLHCPNLKIEVNITKQALLSFPNE